jgi:hypothetical protein
VAYSLLEVRATENSEPLIRKQVKKFGKLPCPELQMQTLQHIGAKGNNILQFLLAGMLITQQDI